MLNYIPFIRDIDFEGFYIRMNEMDFEGQKKAEKVYKLILITFLIASMIVSFVNQKLSLGVILMIAGLAVAMIATVPSWGTYNKNQLDWLPHIKEEHEHRD